MEKSNGEKSKQAMVGQAKHIAAAMAEVQMALEWSEGEGADCTTEQLNKVGAELARALELAIHCGRTWEA